MARLYFRCRTTEILRLDDTYVCHLCIAIITYNLNVFDVPT